MSQQQVTTFTAIRDKAMQPVQLIGYSAILVFVVVSCFNNVHAESAPRNALASSKLITQIPQGTIWNTPYSHNDWKSMLAINQTLISVCVLDTATTAWSVDKIRFYENATPIDRVYTRILNESAVQLIKQWDVPRTFFIKCKYDTTSISLTAVQVDRPPGVPISFRCLSHAMTYLVCILIVEPHQMALSGRVRWSILNGSRSGDCETSGFVGNTLTCTTQHDMPKYERFRFDVQLSNWLGNRSETYAFDRRQAVLADKPDLELLSISAVTGTRLHWNTSANMIPLHEGMQMHYSLKYRSEFDEDWTEQTFGYTETANLRESYRFIAVLDNLHPYARYNATLRASTQPNNPALWSPSAYLTFFHDIVDRPSQPPTVLNGTFHLNSNGNELLVYWTPITRPHWNGPVVGYRLSTAAGGSVLCRTLNNISGLCRTIDGSAITQNPLLIHVQSIAEHNPLLMSAMSSTLSIPRQIDSLPLPVALTTTTYAATHTSNWTRTQVFRWLAPSHGNGIESIRNYTIIWCWDSDDCSGTLNTTTVQTGNVLQVTVNSNETLRFAVAANSADSSSGLRWCDCYRHMENKDKQPVDTAAAAALHHIAHYARGDRIVLELERRCLGLYKSIHIAYCRLDNSQDQSCTTIPHKVTYHLRTDDENVIVLDKLQAKSLYRFSVDATERDSNATTTLRYSSDFTQQTDNSLANDMMLIILICVPVVVSCTALLWFSKYALKKTRRMRDIDIQLPEALADIARWDGHQENDSQNGGTMFEADVKPIQRTSMTSTRESFNEQSARLLNIIEAPVDENVETKEEFKTDPTTNNYVSPDLIVQPNGYILYPAAKAAAEAAAAAQQSNTRNQQLRNANTTESGYVTMKSLLK